jgi:hypothetical protein
VNIVETVKQAIKEATPELTQSLRKTAYEQGWPSDCGRSLFVTCDGEKFDVQMSSQAEDKEFGTGHEPPSAAVRRWSNDTGTIGDILIRAVERRIASVL